MMPFKGFLRKSNIISLFQVQMISSSQTTKGTSMQLIRMIFNFGSGQQIQHGHRIMVLIVVLLHMVKMSADGWRSTVSGAHSRVKTIGKCASYTHIFLVVRYRKK